MIKYLHPFPARMAPNLALDAVAALAPESTVLDPMIGSGTSIIAAARLGHRCHGFDIDPLAIRIARASVARIDSDELLRVGRDLVCELRLLDRRRLKRYPEYFDYETKCFADYWFTASNQRALTFLTRRIKSISSDTYRNVLNVILSSTIVVKRYGASRARDVAHSRPHIDHDYEPRAVEELFLEKLERVACPYFARGQSIEIDPSIMLGDARCLPIVDGSIDLVLTSPPYLNALDYMRGHRLSLVWLGFTMAQLRSIRGGSIGTERTEDRHRRGSRLAAIAECFNEDLYCLLREMRRTLSLGARAVFVLGDNVRETSVICNADYLIDSARVVGLNLLERYSREIPRTLRYLPPPNGAQTSTMDSRMSFESVITFERVF